MISHCTGGSRWLVPASDYDPIAQQAILLKTGDKNPAARAFLDFLKGPEAPGDHQALRPYELQ